MGQNQNRLCTGSDSDLSSVIFRVCPAGETCFICCHQDRCLFQTSGADVVSNDGNDVVDRWSSSDGDNFQSEFPVLFSEK